MSAQSPRVSIGLPTYDRPELLSQVIENFRRQTFTDFELLISDNASTNPAVVEMCERIASVDPRFRYVRQKANLGAAANFWYVYDEARAPLFLWASDDDVWPLDFLERGVAALGSNPAIAAWFCQVANINNRGELVREYPSFSRFHSTLTKPVDLARYLWEPEVMGKANLIYSIFRKKALHEVVDIIRSAPFSWGGDMNLVYGFLCRHRIAIDDRLTLHKRVPLDVIDEISTPRGLIYPWEERELYFENYRKVAAGTGYAAFTSAVLSLRFAYDKWFHLDLEHELSKSVYVVRSSIGRWRRSVLERFRR